jgi:hypothetical protein
VSRPQIGQIGLEGETQGTARGRCVLKYGGGLRGRGFGERSTEARPQPPLQPHQPRLDGALAAAGVLGQLGVTVSLHPSCHQAAFRVGELVEDSGDEGELFWGGLSGGGGL